MAFEELSHVLAPTCLMCYSNSHQFYFGKNLGPFGGLMKAVILHRFSFLR